MTIGQETEITKMYLNNLSAAQIAKSFNISINQVYKSLKAQQITRRNAQEQNKIRFENKLLSYSYLKKLSENQRELESAALMLYLGEGAKAGDTVDFANSNPVLIKIFLRFLRDICQVAENRVKLYLYCFSNQNINDLILFWSKTLQVQPNQFTKPYIKQINPFVKRVMPYGLLHVRYSDKKLLNHLLLLCEKLSVRLATS